MSGILRTQARARARNGQPHPWTRKASRKPAPPPPVADPVERVAPPAKVSRVKAAAAKVRATLRRLFGKRGA